MSYSAIGFSAAGFSKSSVKVIYLYIRRVLCSVSEFLLKPYVIIYVHGLKFVHDMVELQMS